MPNDDLIAALERAADELSAIGSLAAYHGAGDVACRYETDAATIRALIADLRAGNLVRREDVATLNGDFACAVAYDSGHTAGAAQERAKVVAWLRDSQDKGDAAIASAIEHGEASKWWDEHCAIAAGAHEGGGGDA